MHEELIIAGFGGQGVMLIGQLLTYSGMSEGKNVLWMPAYGPETRGGFANCTVIISEQEIYAPIISKPLSLIIMNLPSLDKFEDSLKSGGLIVVNKSLVNREVKRSDVETVMIPATEIATEMGNVRAANMVALGAYIEKRGSVSFESVMEALPKMFPGKEKIIPLNREALKKGAEFVKVSA
ncbi:MAG: 2-oxoacid:acceptor oxidoreductase family protein [Candidatus Eremiobacteraeota bacterium]|nr:2-oxoacid:acceptor oxidoreductase family protein [Candidatus Eremiobacteraeota bacterium]